MTYQCFFKARVTPSPTQVSLFLQNQTLELGQGNRRHFCWYTSGLRLDHYLNSLMKTILKTEKQQLYQTLPPPPFLKDQFDISNYKISI